MIRRLRAFALGIREYRLDCTTSMPTFDEYEAYDLGREWAHRLTLRLRETEGGVDYPWTRRLTLRQGVIR